MKGSGEEVEEGGTGWVEFYDRFGERDVGADDGQDVVLLAASAAPGGEDAVKDTFLIALALNGLERSDLMDKQILFNITWSTNCGGKFSG